MTRKHFEAVAAKLRQERHASANDSERLGVIRASQAIADVFAEANPRFDRARFLDACR